jgi:hypothetical protein
VLRRAKNVRSAPETERDALLEDAERLENWCVGFVFAGIALEAVIAAAPLIVCLSSILTGIGNTLADAAVAVGVLGELRFGNVAGAVLKIKLSDAVERAAKVDLARVALEAKLLPRMLNQDQWDFIQGLRGKFSVVAIAFETDAETRWFSSHVRDAFFSAGISVPMYPRAAEVHSFGILIFEPKGFEGAHPRTVEPLIEIFRKAELIGSLAVITEVPTDVLLSIEGARPEMRAPLDTPMIVIEGRFVIPPPHLERAATAAKAAMDAIANPKIPRESGI